MTNNVLTILAPGSRLKEDIATYGIVGDVMAVNQCILDYSGDIKYAVCCWDKYLDLLMKLRELKNRNVENVQTFTRQLREWFYVNNSGLLALSIANSLSQYTEVRVLGMHVDRTGHYYDLLPDGNEYDLRFTFGVEECEEILKTWSHIKTSPGNLTKFFKLIEQRGTE